MSMYNYEARIFGKDEDGEEVVHAGNLGLTAEQALGKAVQTIQQAADSPFPTDRHWFLEIRVFELNQVMRKDVWSISPRGVTLRDYLGNETQYPS